MIALTRGSDIFACLVLYNLVASYQDDFSIDVNDIENVNEEGLVSQNDNAKGKESRERVIADLLN
jgi:hypothetical protein